MIPPHDLRKEITETLDISQWVDRNLAELLRLCAGRLRQLPVWASTLSALKRELRGWDMNKERWK